MDAIDHLRCRLCGAVLRRGRRGRVPTRCKACAKRMLRVQKRAWADANREKVRESNSRSSKKRRVRDKDAGLCIICRRRSAISGKSRCRRCTRYHAAYQRKHQADYRARNPEKVARWERARREREKERLLRGLIAWALAHAVWQLCAEEEPL